MVILEARAFSSYPPLPTVVTHDRCATMARKVLITMMLHDTLLVANPTTT